MDAIAELRMIVSEQQDTIQNLKAEIEDCRQRLNILEAWQNSE